MSGISRWIARWIYGGTLRFSRRLYVYLADRFGGNDRDAYMKRLRSGDRAARRYGLKLITFAINILVASVLITGTWLFVTWMSENGMLEVPTPQQDTVM